MIGDRDTEHRLRRHLAAEADELPFLVDAETVRGRLTERPRRRFSLAVLPAAAALVLAVAVGGALVAGPGPTDQGDAGDWGPLAVMDMNGGMDALNIGVLRISADCVVLDTADGESELLVWPADRTQWDAANASIGFTNPDGRRFTLHDRDTVSFGGGGQSTSESGLSGAEWVASVDWVAAPHPSCPMETRWFVSEVADPPPPETPTPSPVPQADLVGIIRGEPELEGGACPVLLTDVDGERWEVYLTEPFRREHRGDVMVIIGPEGEEVARTGDRVGFNVEPETSGGSLCMAGTPVRATALVFVQPQDQDPRAPMQNALEALVTDALAVLGVDALRAEYSPESAFMWAPFGDDSALLVHAFRGGTDGGEFSVIDERSLDGVTIQRVEYASGPVRDRFECQDATYEVEGATPPGFGTFDAFLAEFIGLLDC